MFLTEAIYLFMLRDKKGHFTTICRIRQDNSDVQAAKPIADLCAASKLTSLGQPGPPPYQERQQ